MAAPGKRLPAFAKKALNPYVDEATALAAEFLKEAKARFDAELSYDLDAVRALDKVCRYNRAAFDDGLILKAGFFLGEVLRRAYRGKYQWDARVKALSLRVGELVAFPVEKVRKVVVERDEGTFEEYLMVFAKKLADHRRAKGAKP